MVQVFCEYTAGQHYTVAQARHVQLWSLILQASLSTMCACALTPLITNQTYVYASSKCNRVVSATDAYGMRQGRRCVNVL